MPHIDFKLTVTSLVLGTLAYSISAPAKTNFQKVQDTQILYEAELATLSRNAKIVGAADGSDRAVGDLGGEASNRQAVTLPKLSSYVSFTTTADSNAFTIRYSIPDAPGGGGQQDILGVTITSPSGTVLFPTANTPVSNIVLTSRYSWVYSSSTSPQNALKNIPPAVPIPFTNKVYDEVQLQLGQTIPAGSTIKLTNKTANNLAYTIDFLETEMVSGPLPQPDNFLSLTSDCGVVPTDTNALGQNTNTGSFNYVFSGVDDLLFPGSTFQAYTGPNPPAINPINDSSAYVYELDYYTSPQDASMNALAASNATNLNACLAKLATSNFNGIYVPVGRYYISGLIKLPNNAQIIGAGMWYSKFVAVDTGAPVPVTINGISGVQGQTGNPIFAPIGNSADSVVLSQFSIFGNVTQRDNIDNIKPVALQGQFTNSTFDNLWIEHYRIGLQVTGNPSNITYTNVRVRNTFADGMDFYGGVINSTISNAEVRGAGDDGIAIWSQSSKGVTQASANNTITNADVHLNWSGHGIAIYGGVNNTVENSIIADTIRLNCLDIGSQNSPFPTPTMTASANNLNLIRCGGPDVDFGAMYSVYDNNNIPNIDLSFSNINIYTPSNGGIDIRDENSSSPDLPKMNVSYNNVAVLTSSLSATCMNFVGPLNGSLTATDLYTCASTTSAAHSCKASGSSTFPVKITPVTPGMVCNM